MPTYDYKCDHCSRTDSKLQSIGEYSRSPDRPQCPEHGEMVRSLSVVPAMSGLANALAGDRHYDGLRATDGTDISSRTKHREYMKSKGLAMTGDFKDTWASAQKERDALRAGTFVDKELRSEVAKQVMTAVAQPD
jgi:putative FmdB family regulatory protein